MEIPSDPAASPPSSRLTLGGVKIADPHIRRGLVYSLWDGVFATVMLAVTETFGVAAAVSLQAPNLAIALLGSLPLCIGSLGQFVLGLFVTSATSRRRYVVSGVFVQVAFLILCSVSGFPQLGVGWALYVLTFVLFGVSGNLTSMFWIAWMRELLPANVRGRLFAWRNRAFAVVQLSASLGLGFIARRYTAAHTPWTFFTAIFLLAALSRALSGLMLSFQYEPERVPASVPTGWTYPNRDFLLFALATALLQGATAVAGPFFNVWFLRELHFDYLTLSVCSAATISGSVLTLPLWGKLADRVGNFRLLKAAALMVCVIPLPYLYFSSRYLVWSFNFYSGVAWSAFGLSQFNTMLESVGTRNAEREISIVVAMSGVAVFLCGLLGGILATHLPALNGSTLRSVFLSSALMRLVVVVVLFRVLRPIAPLPDVTALEAFHDFPAYRAGMGLLRAVFRAFRKS